MHRADVFTGLSGDARRNEIVKLRFLTLPKPNRTLSPTPSKPSTTSGGCWAGNPQTIELIPIFSRAAKHPQKGRIEGKFVTKHVLQHTCEDSFCVSGLGFSLGLGEVQGFRDLRAWVLNAGQGFGFG